MHRLIASNRQYRSSHSALVRAVAFVIFQKLAVDLLSACKAFVDAVPVADAGLAHSPAEIDFPSVEKRRKVDQADIDP